MTNAITAMLFSRNSFIKFDVDPHVYLTHQSDSELHYDACIELLSVTVVLGPAMQTKIAERSRDLHI